MRLLIRNYALIRFFLKYLLEFLVLKSLPYSYEIPPLTYPESYVDKDMVLSFLLCY